MLCKNNNAGVILRENGIYILITHHGLRRKLVGTLRELKSCKCEKQSKKQSSREQSNA